MAAPIRPQQPLDPASGMVPMPLEQFLAWEEQQERRYEFVDGFVRAMTGGTLRHNAITGNVYSLLRGPARAAGYRAHFTDVQIPNSYAERAHVLPRRGGALRAVRLLRQARAVAVHRRRGHLSLDADF